MMCHERGLFQLADPVHKYLGPAWRKENMAVYLAGLLTPGGQGAARARGPWCHLSLTIPTRFLLRLHVMSWKLRAVGPAG